MTLRNVGLIERPKPAAAAAASITVAPAVSAAGATAQPSAGASAGQGVASIAREQPVAHHAAGHVWARFAPTVYLWVPCAQVHKWLWVVFAPLCRTHDSSRAIRGFWC